MNQEDKTRKALKKAMLLIGQRQLGIQLGLSYQSILGWVTRGSMPQTEYSCRTHYSQDIERITGGKVTVEQLLGHRPACMPDVKISQ